MTNQSNSTQDIEDVVAELRQIAELILDDVMLGAGTLGAGRANAARKADDFIQSLSGRIDVLEGALKPFADCVDQIADDEDDEEWAKFRLLIKDYRRARAALHQEGIAR